LIEVLETIDDDIFNEFDESEKLNVKLIIFNLKLSY